MEKRLPIALVLSMLFLLWYLGQFTPPPEEGAELDGASPPASGAVDDGGTPGAPAGATGTPAGTSGGPTDPPPVDVPVSDAPDRELEVVTQDTLAVWRAKGASLASLDLRDYRTEPGADDPMPLAGAVDGPAGNFLLRDVNGRYGLDRVNWEVEERMGAGGAKELVFSLQSGDRAFRRIVRHEDDPSRPHTFSMTVEVTNTAATRSEPLTLVQQSARGLVDEEAGSVFYGQPAALAVVQRGPHEPEIVQWKGDDLSGDPRRVSDDERLLAAGTITNYFASILVPTDDTPVRQVFPVAVEDLLKLERHVEAKAPADEREAEALRRELRGGIQAAAAVELQLWVPALDPGETTRFTFDVYNGPQALEAAAVPGYGFLTKVIESAYGNWGWINRTLLQILRFFHGIVGNWGVAIILLTVLVKGILFPLNRRQQTSMAKYSAVMQKLKPQLDELKAKYKNNTRKYNEEQMKLLKQEGASPPLGGCLLMFLQFPIWISLFQILGTSIELRQSHFVGWIDDLSRPDAMPFGMAGFETINLLPLLMAVATMAQMKAQVKPADPQQAQTQKIMGMVMPIFMLWFLYSYSSGLSLYIFTSSLIGIFEYQVIRRIWPVAGLPGPAAKKA